MALIVGLRARLTLRCLQGQAVSINVQIGPGEARGKSGDCAEMACSSSDGDVYFQVRDAMSLREVYLGIHRKITEV